MATTKTAPAPAASAQPPTGPLPAKRGRGRPVEAGAGPLQRVNVTLDAEARAIAERIEPGSTSRAIREALRFWAQQHPEAAP